MSPRFKLEKFTEVPKDRIPKQHQKIQAKILSLQACNVEFDASACL